MLRVAPDRVDQRGDEVMAPFELNADAAPGLLHKVPAAD